MPLCLCVSLSLCLSVSVSLSLAVFANAVLFASAEVVTVGDCKNLHSWLLIAPPPKKKRTAAAREGGTRGWIDVLQDVLKNLLRRSECCLVIRDMGIQRREFVCV